jgi:hypothetical protein
MWLLVILGVLALYSALVVFITNYYPVLFFPLIFLPAAIVLLMEMSHNTWKTNLGLLTIGLIGCLCSTI